MLSPQSAQQLRQALRDPAVVSRYQHLIWIPDQADRCHFWVGAVAGHGHGRFWIGRGVCVIAHRFGYGRAHGFDALTHAPVVEHTACDNPLCQNPAHLSASTVADNTGSWATRRHNLGGPLRDRRGALARALAVRDAVRAGHDPRPVEAAGMTVGDKDQLPLW